MKKIMMVLLAVTFSMFAFSLCVYAREIDYNDEVLYELDLDLDSYEDLLNDFEITGGIGDKDVEATFDLYRTITGVAQKDTTVYIYIFLPDSDDEFNIMKDYYEITVGRSGVFSKDIDLEIGENKIVVYAEKDGMISFPVQIIINRKSMDIKLELEGRTIILPGRTKASSSS